MISILRGGFLMSIGDFPESLSQVILIGIIVVGRFGIHMAHFQFWLVSNWARF